MTNDKDLKQVKEDPESTTITFRIKVKDKEEIQQLAKDFAEGNLTKFIKRAVKSFKRQNEEAILQKRDFWNKDVIEMVKKQANSDDPAVIQAKLEEAKPRLMMQRISEFEEQMRHLQKEFKDGMDALIHWKLKFD